MNDSGTNSVKPPVRSCSSRITRMCSASSHGSSMWPNITVAVERRPTRGCLDHLIQRATGSLFGEMRARDAVIENLGRGPGRRAEPGVAQALEHVRRRQTGDVAHVCDLHRRVRVQVQLRRDPLREPQPVLIVSSVQSGWMPDWMHSSVAPNATASRTRRTKSSRSARRHPGTASPGRSRRTRSRRYTRWRR